MVQKSLAAHKLRQARKLVETAKKKVRQLKAQLRQARVALKSAKSARRKAKAEAPVKQASKPAGLKTVAVAVKKAVKKAAKKVSAKAPAKKPAARKPCVLCREAGCSQEASHARARQTQAAPQDGEDRRAAPGRCGYVCNG